MEALTIAELERFIAKVDPPEAWTDCWNWRGARSGCGYGTFWLRGKYMRAHRVGFLLNGEPLIQGMAIDHLCRNRFCVNPMHLRQVTNRENITAEHSLAPSAINRRKTHCIRGHVFDTENTWVSPSGKRGCRKCHNMHQQNFYKLYGRKRDRNSSH